jgi:hypothetical protein
MGSSVVIYRILSLIDCCKHLDVNWRGDTQTKWRSHKPILGKHAKNIILGLPVVSVFIPKA